MAVPGLQVACCARIRVYGGGHFDECLGLVGLGPNEADGVSVDELYLFLSQLREGKEAA